MDNFLTYTEETCILNEFCNDKFYLQLSNVNFQSVKQYKDILKFITEHKIDLNNILFSDVKIHWDNYCGTTYDASKVSLVPHNWCDFFTSENGVPRNGNSLNYSLHILPDGWISDDWEIWQPAETDVDTKDGFAAYGLRNKVCDIINVLKNFTYIILDQERGYIVDGLKMDSLPTYLNNYNGEDWIINKLRKDTKVYFSDKPYLNKMMLYMFKAHMENNEKEKLDVNAYLKEHKGSMRFQEMYEIKFFIKLYEM